MLPSSNLTNPQTFKDLLLYRLTKLASTGSTSVIRLCEGQLGITRREWRILASLGSGGAQSSSELAETAQLDRARTSRAVSSLLEKGLVHRHAVPSDQRKATITLTKVGIGIYQSFFPTVVAINQRLMQGLDAHALQVLDSAITLIQAEAEKLHAEAGQPKANRRRGGKK